MQAAKDLANGVHQHGSHDPIRVAEEDSRQPLSATPTPSTPGEQLVFRGPDHAPAVTSHPRPAHLKRIETGVSVEQAQADFAELSREFSGISQNSEKQERKWSRKDSTGNERDVEKVETRESQRFNLEDTLRGNRELDMEEGIRAKRIGVLWEDLRVCGIGGVRNFIKTFPDAFVDFFNVPGTIMSLFGLGKKGREFDILNGFRGLAKPGEMVLVLGKPSSGCTTFLKVIANQRFGYTKVEGDVLYGPYDAKTFGTKYRGEAVYNQEDDIQSVNRWTILVMDTY